MLAANPGPQSLHIAASYTSAVTIPSPIVLEGVEDTLLTLGAPGVLANATAPAGFNVSVYSYSQPASGCANVTLGTDGALTMMPAKGFFGNCSFLLWVLDNQSKVVKATVAAVFGERVTHRRTVPHVPSRCIPCCSHHRHMTCPQPLLAMHCKLHTPSALSRQPMSYSPCPAHTPPAEVIHNVIAPANSIYVPGAFESTTFQLAPPGVLKQFKKPPSFNLTVYNYTQPASGCGTVQLAPDGGMDFEPNPAFVGTCSFNFSVLDEKQMPLQATVLVNVGEQTLLLSLTVCTAWVWWERQGNSVRALYMSACRCWLRASAETPCCGHTRADSICCLPRCHIQGPSLQPSPSLTPSS